jgi:hypothetical protein
VEVILCPNGCTDGSEAVVDRFIATEQNLADVRKVGSEPGLVRAQRAIVAARKLDSLLMFFDADIRLDCEAVYALWKCMANDPRVQVAYACVIPVAVSGRGWLASLLQARYAHTGLFGPRRYFHGRAFAIRDWSVPNFTDPAELTPYWRDLISDPAWQGLRLDQGPLVDDIFLSRFLAYEYGVGSMRECPEARVFYTPVATLQDYYLRCRRVFWELKRLDLLFPHHRYLQERQFDRRPCWDYVHRLSWSARLGLFAYLLVDSAIRKVVAAEFLAIHLGLFPGHGEIFTHCRSTKRALIEAISGG